MLGRLLFSMLSALTLSSISTFAFAEDMNLSVEDAHSQAQKGKITLIDIRTPGEWQKTGTPEHAEMVQLQRDDFVETIINKSKANPNIPIALICRSGGRSTRAIKILESAGLSGVYNVKEGSLGWQAKELPMSPYTPE